MTLDKLEASIYEAKRFLRRAEAAKKHTVKHGDYQMLSDGKANAACKRASLDLTRALAELRKPETY